MSDFDCPWIDTRRYTEAMESFYTMLETAYKSPACITVPEPPIRWALNHDSPMATTMTRCWTLPEEKGQDDDQPRKATYGYFQGYVTAFATIPDGRNAKMLLSILLP